MKLLVVIAPEKFRDEELEEPLAVFRREGIAYDIVSTCVGTCVGMLGAEVDVEVEIANVDPAAYDGIVIIGGTGAQDYLWGDPRLENLVCTFDASGKLLAAICLSPAVLAMAGVLQGKRATVFRTPSSVSVMEGGRAQLVNEHVVMDGRIVTADGPPAARKFGEAVATTLKRMKGK
ncbi:MAG: DJ-1/PfpI family protein [Methanomicrobiales archaeon]|nr:DJ-1/PfpI family protein [Methanomicrobiales archaeon]